jgi:hypothetical protein
MLARNRSSQTRLQQGYILPVKTVHIYADALDRGSKTTYEVPHVGWFLNGHFKKWPASTRVYNGVVSQETDVTPLNEGMVTDLENCKGPIRVVLFPEDPGTLIVASIIASLAAAAVGYALTPSAGAGSLVATGNEQASSPNGQLGQPQNKARPGGQIPYILGYDKSVPDLLNLPFDFYENNRQFQINWMCVGVGEHDIDTDFVRDGETRLEYIKGGAAEIYGPNTKPGDTPQLRIGDAITEPLRIVEKVAGVDGQLLESPNSQRYKSQVVDLTPSYPNILTLDPGSDAKLSDIFNPGNTVTLTLPGYTGNVISGALIYAAVSSWVVVGGSFRQIRLAAGSPAALGLWVGANFTTTGLPSNQSGSTNGQKLVLSIYIATGAETEDVISYVDVSSNPLSQGNYPGLSIGVTVTAVSTRSPQFDGTYQIATVDEKQLTLTAPELVQDGWDWMGYIDLSPQQSGEIVANSVKSIGSFFCESDDIEKFSINLIASRGLYVKSSSTGRQNKKSVVFNVEVTPADASGTASGAAAAHSITFDGSATDTGQLGATFTVTPATAGRHLIKIWRVTDTDYDYAGTVVDDIQLRDIYFLSPHGKTGFGDVTTVYMKSTATEEATSQSGLAINLRVGRKILTRLSDGTFTTVKTATSRVDDQLAFILQDARFGRRSAAEIDFVSIYGAVSEAESAFGHVSAIGFNGTFSRPNVTFRDILPTVAGAANCFAYRRGSVAKAIFKGKKLNSNMLFNHRNILPRSQKIDFSPGTKNGHDGVEYVYKDSAYKQATISLPDGYIATNSKRIESRGIVGKLQAHFNAKRAWSEIQIQNEFTTFDATEEAATLVRGERIMVAEQTRANTQDGDVVASSGDVVTLSRSITLEVGESYLCFLMHKDRTVEIIAVLSSASGKQVTLATTPNQALVVDDAKNTKTKFNIVKVADSVRDVYTVTDVKRKGPMTYTVSAANYSDAFFASDEDYLNGVVNVDGDTI